MTQFFPTLSFPTAADDSMLTALLGLCHCQVSSFITDTRHLYQVPKAIPAVTHDDALWHFCCFKSVFCFKIIKQNKTFTMWRQSQLGTALSDPKLEERTAFLVHRTFGCLSFAVSPRLYRKLAKLSTQMGWPPGLHGLSPLSKQRNKTRVFSGRMRIENTTKERADTLQFIIAGNPS